MKLPRPQSLNGLILIGFALVALPMVIAVVWALVNLDRLARQSEDLVVSGVSAAENNRQLAQQVASLERIARQYLVLQTPDSQSLLRQDQAALETTLDELLPLAELANAGDLALSIRQGSRRIVNTLLQTGVPPEQAETAVAEFGELRQNVSQLSTILGSFIESQLNSLQQSMSRAQKVSAWQTAALIPGTAVLVLIFTLLIARPIRQLDRAIHQLGQGGFSKPIEVNGPTDLERLGGQLEWLRQRLLELAQEKNRFLRHMSHELKTPLANIREGTELLLDGSVGTLDEAQTEVAGILRANSLKLQQLIENLLAFSAWQTKSEVLSLSEFSLRSLLLSVIKAQQLALTGGKIQLRVDVEDAIVSADRDKMRTVFDNLLSNAVKFTPKGGSIMIRARSMPRAFVVEVADSGPGIPDSEKPRIFDAFFQGKQEQGGQVAGTGIGLSVVQECIHAHHGFIELIDSEEFSGAHFRVEIPQSRDASASKVAASA